MLGNYHRRSSLSLSLSKASLNQINHPACNRRREGEGRGLEYRGRSREEVDRVEAKVEERGRERLGCEETWKKGRKRGGFGT